MKMRCYDSVTLCNCRLELGSPSISLCLALSLFMSSNSNGWRAFEAFGLLIEGFDSRFFSFYLYVSISLVYVPYV